MALASRAPLRGRTLVQALALVAAGALAYNGARILNESPRSPQPVLENYDAAMPWLGAALLATLIAAWLLAPPRLSPRSWPGALAGFWRSHWMELLLFAAIFGFGVFMRVYQFGDTLPPSDGLCCEEQINGGAAYRALQGERPLNFLLPRWTAAAGLLVFGENTLGLRFFFPVLGIATLVAFYLLLRQLVSVPAALFGLALYAAAWWPSLRSRQPTEGTIYTVVFALLLVRGLRTRGPLTWLGVGVLAGLLSYEYEPFKAVPIIAALFLAAAAVREIVLRAPFALSAVRERAGALLAAAWRPALVALIAVGIVLVPTIVSTHHGQDLYLTSVHRQEEGRSGARFAEEWPKQLKWAAEIFLPVGPNEYPSSAPRAIAGEEPLDPVAGGLAVAGLVVAAALFLRGVRLFFVAWVVLSVTGGALLLHDFGTWKFVGLVPPFLVLAMLLVDDARALVARAFGPAATRALGGLLAVGAGFSFWWNADTLFNDVAPSRPVAESYGGEGALAYSLCHYLQGRGTENYSFVFSRPPALTGFASPRDTFAQQARVWGDAIWVCHDLEGTALPAPDEAWPLRGVPSGPLTLAFADPIAPVDGVIDELNRAYPGLGQPDRRAVGPADSYTYIAYEFATSEELFRPGLWADYLPIGGEEPVASRVDLVSSLTWEAGDLPLPPPFTVRWRGLAYLEERGAFSLRAVTEEPVEVRLDGQLAYSTKSGEPRESFVDLLPGWHPVEITLDKQHEGGSVRLAWATPDGRERAVLLDDLFPLAELSGWIQTRSVGVPGDPEQQVSQRLDFAPHYVSGTVVRLLAQRGTSEPILTEERWRGVWQVEEPGDYRLGVEFMAGAVTLLVDGAPVATAEAPLQGSGLMEADVALPAGPHALEIIQQLGTDVSWAGAVVSASRHLAPEGEQAAPEPVPLRVTPY